MRKNKYIIITILSALLFLTTSCRDDMAEINSNPSQITEANISYLFAEAVKEFQPAGYTFWFYNAPLTFKWAQMGVSTSGYTDQFNRSTATGDQGSQTIALLKYVRDIEHVRNNVLDEEEAAKYANLAACVDVMAVYLGLFDSDMFGDRPYTEAAMARYGGTLTPKYDKVEDLYNVWLETLDEAITTLTTSTDQIFPPAQDVAYNGDVAKWAKLANSTKLKIAARLISQNRSKALEIASEVANNPVGVLDGEEDDFMFNKASSVTSDDHDLVYHWNNGFMETTASSQRVVDFMLKNKDPRVRFFYRKNAWNSKIVQGFFDQNKEDAIPYYILENVEYTEKDGKKTFVAWKGMGEPWVRYYGLPVEMGAQFDKDKYGDYFDYTNRARLKIGDSEKTYTPFSGFNQEMIIGRYDFTYPTLPGDEVIQDVENMPWYGMYISTAEINLYLAEFKLLGANLPKTAQEYFTKATRASVEEYNRLARLNKIPYYGEDFVGNNYDPHEKEIDLQPGEIEAMVANADYQLTGDKALDLEKVYIQQLIHFTLLPNEQFVTARRSGVPKENSTMIAWENFSPVVNNNEIPRRFEVTSPNQTDLMFDVLTESYKSQGFTPGTNQDGSVLNSERVWQDKNAPQFGEGPKM